MEPTDTGRPALKVLMPIVVGVAPIDCMQDGCRTTCARVSHLSSGIEKVFEDEMTLGSTIQYKQGMGYTGMGYCFRSLKDDKQI